MKKKTRFLALALLPVLLLGAVIPCFAWSAANTRAMGEFTDLDQNRWYYKDVEWAVRAGIMKNNGDSTKFEPNTSLTRAMFTQICYSFLQNGLEKDVSYTSTAPFSDLKAGAWYEKAVSFAYENGIVKGMGDNLFEPNSSITRQQMAVLYLSLIENYFGMKMDADLSLLDQFSDKDQIAGWAQRAVAAMVGINMLYGRDNGTFDPKGESTRAEAAALIRRFYDYYGKTAQLYLGKDVKLIPTMLEDFDGEGLHGWNDNFWHSAGFSNADCMPRDDAGNVKGDEVMYTADGNLYMTAYYPGEANTDDNGICRLISGHDLPTKFSQAYGFYEIRFKPAPARAICSAWWLTTNGSSTQAYPSWDPDNTADRNNPPYINGNTLENFVEMDIFETTRAPQDPTNPNVSDRIDKFTSTLHWNHWSRDDDGGRYSHHYVSVDKKATNRGTFTEKGNYLPATSMFDGNYHTVGFLWTEDGYKVWYDGNYMGDFEGAANSNMEAVLRLNLYYWNTTKEKPYNGDCFAEDFVDGKSQFVVDYVHVYQLSDYVENYAPDYHGNEIPSYYTEAIAK